MKKGDTILTDYAVIPEAVRELTNNVVIAADVMFVNELPFLASTSTDMKFMTSKYLASSKKKDLERG